MNHALPVLEHSATGSSDFALIVGELVVRAVAVGLGGAGLLVTAAYTLL